MRWEDEHGSSQRVSSLLVAAEVEAVLEQRLGVASELPKERCDVAVMSAFVQEQMDDQLTPAVSDGVAVDVNHAWFAEFGVGPCIEMDRSVSRVRRRWASICDQVMKSSGARAGMG